MLDMDGTALYERKGVIYVPDTVEAGLKAVHEVGRPIVLNTLRFPLSILSTFGEDWYEINKAPIPTVLLNGSLLGYITQSHEGTLGYDEVMAFPLTHDEIEEIMVGIEGLVANSVDLVFFFYPRDWTMGEIIWTPNPDQVSCLEEKYLSASEVFSSSTEELKLRLFTADVMMIHLRVNTPLDDGMAYQHADKREFMTHEKVDKTSGAICIAKHLGVSLADTIGAGDTPMDTFLDAVGLAVHVGPLKLDYMGTFGTMTASDPFALGELLVSFAEQERGAITG
jgi:hypothetical protein